MNTASSRFSGVELFFEEFKYLDVDIFTDQKPLNIEIGCGQDPFILKMASLRPEENFVGIELERWVLNKLLKKAARVSLPNVKLIRYDARKLIFQKVPDRSINAFYINHPDPWPKKRHRNRRLINDPFLDLLLSKLTDHGRIYYSSDFEDYAAAVGGKLFSTGAVKSLFPGRIYTTEFPDYPRTRFMRRFLNLGQPIFFVAMEKSSETSFSQY